ncbi:MAG: metallophosphoesterase family protein [Planctomycetales bacterium]|nr:metallophosphoesterase family protein [Planctomycetales bacterium]
MNLAIISDVHGNLEALHAVLADAADQGIEQIYCLGDIVGYGPDPGRCLDVVMDLDVAILGNHDQGVLFPPEGFSSGAERAIFWTRDRLNSDADETRRIARWNFLCGLPRQVHVDHLYTFVHGSARNPLTEYVFPEDIHNPGKLDRIFGLIQQYCFQGHTHVPGIFTEAGNFGRPSDFGYEYTLGREKLMINVGSVGQPRDGDHDASYVVLKEGRVRFRRVPYPYQQTMEKIFAIPELDRFLGERLAEGR